jgi:hypothetical protein
MVVVLPTPLTPTNPKTPKPQVFEFVCNKLKMQLNQSYFELDHKPRQALSRDRSAHKAARP